jgi:hypothetical protein
MGIVYLDDSQKALILGQAGKLLKAYLLSHPGCQLVKRMFLT